MLIYFVLVVVLVVLIPIGSARAKAEVKAKQTQLVIQDISIDSIPFKSSKKKWPVWQLGHCIIYEKDGSEIRNALIKEIHDHWIVYEKNGSLHDFMIEKIDRIGIGSNRSYAVYFDTKGKPYIWYF